MTGIVGAVFSFGFNFAPVDWVPCDGRMLSISQYQALFSLLGTTYGGNGVTTFAVPNLHGRVPIGAGQGPGLHNYVLGQSGGSETVTLLASNLPVHTHPLLSAAMPASNNTGELNDPTDAYFGVADSNIGSEYSTTGPATMASTNSTTGVTGSGIPISILNQYQVVNYCICVNGIFPTRN
jgi:microcystin-dependent protein